MVDATIESHSAPMHRPTQEATCTCVLSLRSFFCKWPAAFMLVTLLFPATASQVVAEELEKTASWRWPEVSIYEQHLLSYLDQRQAEDRVREDVDTYWNGEVADENSDGSLRGPQLLNRLLTAAGLVDPRIKDLQANLSDPTLRPVFPRDLDWLTSDVPGWLQDTIRLACGRAFAQRDLYDEALETLTGLELVQVCDPASLIFYRAVSEHHLLKQDECITNVDLLLEREEELPSRYKQIARLIKADIGPLKEDSLDEVARLMRDVERRLGLGRAGTRVRDEEKKIVDKLDKLIDKIEQQLQQQQQQQQQDSDSSQGQSTPMEDSQIAGGSGAGDVDNRDIGDRSGWGNLPPAERQKALQRLTEELPSHYREVIEGYFRQLAKENG